MPFPADTPKSPCLDCIIHLRGLDKKDTTYPCITCMRRMDYVASVTDFLPMLPQEDCIYPIASDQLTIWEYVNGQ